MHLTYRREKEVSNVAECQQGHDSCRKSGSVLRVGTSLAEYNKHCATFPGLTCFSLLLCSAHNFDTSYLPDIIPCPPLLCIYMYLQSNSKNEKVE